MQITYNPKRLQSSRVLLLQCISFFLLGFHLRICNGTSVCNPANYTNAKATIFQSNLNIVLTSLVSHINSSLDRFNTSVSGQSPDTAYGFLQCRGDATVDECYSCSQAANTSIRNDCGNATGGRTLLEKCFLRYENYSFVGKLDTQTMIYYNLGNATDPDVFTKALKGLFTNLSEQAYGSANRYASGTTMDSSFQKIFGLVQCWRDIISIDDCTLCLSTAISSLLEVTVTAFSGTHLGGVAVLGSCTARFETYPFFNTASPPPLFQLPTLRPIQRPPLSPPTPKKSSHKVAIVLGIFGGLLVMLLLFLFAIRKKLKSAVFGNGYSN